MPSARSPGTISASINLPDRPPPDQPPRSTSPIDLPDRPPPDQPPRSTSPRSTPSTTPRISTKSARKTTLHRCLRLIRTKFTDQLNQMSHRSLGRFAILNASLHQ